MAERKNFYHRYIHCPLFTLLNISVAIVAFQITVNAVVLAL